MRTTKENTRRKPKSAAYTARIRELPNDKDYLERIAKCHADFAKLLEEKSLDIRRSQARVQLAEHKEICVKENAEKLDTKESKVQNGQRRTTEDIGLAHEMAQPILNQTKQGEQE